MSVLLSDEPTRNDLLERMELAQEIGETIAKCDPPCVLGVHGDWGSGKTSFLHVLHHYLTGECPQAAFPKETVNSGHWSEWKPKDHIAVIWFEAWRYQHEAAPVVALLHEIRAQLPTASKLLAETKKLAEVAVKSALFSMERVTKWIGFQASKIQEVGEKWEKEHLAEQLPSHTLRQFLEEALKKLLPTDDNARLVILVDDLDRCESQAAYRLLEGIKIYLNLPNCVFVLGVNQASIEASLAEQLAKEKADKPNEEAKQRARDYLDKICKNYWHLPACQHLDLLVNHWLNNCLKGTPAHAEFEKATIGKLIQDHRCLPANPRRIKAFVNTLARFLSRIVDKHGAARFDSLHETCVVLAYLLQFHPEIYRVLEWHPAFYNELYEWCRMVPAEGVAVHDLLRPLGRSYVQKVDPTSVTPGTSPIPSGPSADPLIAPGTMSGPSSTIGPPPGRSTYPDPARGNVFRIQHLVVSLKNKVTAGTIDDCLLR